MKVRLMKYDKVKTKCHQNWKYGEEVDGYNVMFEREDKKKYILHFAEAGPNFNGVMIDGKKYLLDSYTQIGFKRASYPKKLMDEMINMAKEKINEDCKNGKRK